MNFGNNLLLINDDPAITRFLNEELAARGHYAVSCETYSQAGLETFKRNSFDAVVVKIGMPDLQTAELIRGFKRIDPDCVFIGFIEDPGKYDLDEIVSLGIYDFITKPVDSDKLLFIVKRSVELHSLLIAHRRLTYGLQEQNLSLQKQNALLAKRIEESTKNLSRLYEDLRLTYLRTIKAFAQAIDARDHYTHSHSQNVAKYAVAIAEAMHFHTKDIEIIREACELHDLGKIGVQDSILSKPSSLTPEEWEQIRRHPLTAVQILQSLPLLNGVTDLIKQHHEHYDGSGYPEGRKGEDIFIGARIIHLADAYEAMRTPRSYRKIPLLKEEAVGEIKKHSGTQFDPRVVEEFLRIVDKLESL